MDEDQNVRLVSALVSIAKSMETTARLLTVIANQGESRGAKAPAGPYCDDVAEVPPMRSAGRPGIKSYDPL